MWRLIGICTLAAACLVLADRPRDARAEAPTYDFSNVTTLIENTVTSQGLDGASLILVKDGQVIYEHYFGSYNAATTVPIASSTKWLSAATFMTLVDDGTIGLDDPVSDYLPEWTGAMGAITMRQLWSLTSGLVDEHPCMDDLSTTLAACVEQIRLAGLVAPPGSQFYYGGASMMVAGRVAEVATGQSWAQMYQQRIKNPIGLPFTGYGFTANPRISGGAFSRLNEYASLLQMLLDGGTYGPELILRPDSVREMQKDQTFGAPIAYTPHPDARRYGIGEWRDIVDGGGNAVQVSSQGKFGFSPWIDNQRGYLGVFLVNDLLFPSLYPVVALAQGMIRTELDTFDTDGDDTQDSIDSDDDADGLTDAFERACGTFSADAASIQPERTDSAFAGVDDDGDGWTDELLPGYSENFDCDRDGFTGAAESHIYSYLPQTNGDQKACQEYDLSHPNPNVDTRPSKRWPLDFYKGGISLDAITLQDLTSFLAPVRYFNTNKGANPGDVRWDLVPGKGPYVADINLQDLTAIVASGSATGAPPMLGGARAFGNPGPACPWPL